MNDPVTATSEIDAVPNERGSRSARRRAWAIGIALVLTLAVGGALYLYLARAQDTSAASGAASEQSRAALTVTTATPQRVTWPDVLIAQGAIAAWQEASIGTQIGNYQLIDVRANVGDQVRGGQVLARLDPALLRAEEAQFLARQAQADANDQRALGLQDVGGISEQEALQFATEAKTASALLAAKRLELQYTTIRAPDDGVISARSATLGAVVAAGQELFRMIRKNRLEWRGELTAQEMAVARRGQMVTLSLPGSGNARARIREFAPSLDAASRLGIVYADILPGSAARGGMYVNGAIAVGETEALVVPAECVVIRDGRSYVMLVSKSAETSTVTLHAVTTGRRDSEQIEITQGLTGTEHLVRRGAGFLDDGDIVDIAKVGKTGS
jgi:RND family efflux transporter MFP subunit